jgi:probable H4MPT-linked C1 transfer pathway protein
MVIAEAPPCDRLAVTMTGELADCYESKSSGVLQILEAVEQAAGGRHVRVYRNDGQLVAPAAVRREPLRAAATNWHALARYAGRFAPQGEALVVDIGSSTSDLIPLHDGHPADAAASDLQRLLAGELVYTGVERSPVCAILSTAPYRGQQCPVAQELFATSLDAFLLLGRIRENPANTNTADGRSATKAAARTRLGRMLCAADGEFNHRDAVAIASAVLAAQAELIAGGLRQVGQSLPAPLSAVILCGRGERLGRDALQLLPWEGRTVPLSKELGPAVSRCAPAHALAVLAIG